MYLGFVAPLFGGTLHYGYVHSSSQLVRERSLCVWEFNEGDTKFLSIVKLVPPKDLGSIVHLGIIH
jgi:hypothetical protein